MDKKPYLVIPFLFEQPTWGGEYICKKKGWHNKPNLQGKKIGQSYELYGKSLLAASITTSNDPSFSPKTQNTVPISSFKEEQPFPLIKFTQAKGNSFQLHVMPTVKDTSWRPKAESWYFFEPGKMTFGIKKGALVSNYKKTCLTIEKKMKELSAFVLEKKLTREGAQKKADEFVQEQNPWNYVNVHVTKKGDVVDLSGGGLHHSWEEDPVTCPLGNILYEVQQDVMDPVSTIRSFDQGKIKEDGTIREIQIEDYFKYLDTSEKRNTLILQKNEKDILFDTPYYSLCSYSIESEKEMNTTTSFHHIFVEEGTIDIVDKNKNRITVGAGHSGFIPQGIFYTLIPRGKSTLLLTFIR